ncbi:RNA polymerase sigma-70 factor, ECF subfamily [Actinokineospora diospyrosa]|uniref:RNA polymerase sigma-70 factor, ECF subfamily n=1 Tax=Actinokineospora diospyrosa TaxID=103728 RepID=A0ABT1IMS3_9PSEU|nr:RNA polymerase sigma-70 factor, ECF subfamily [Actinokineospora diospyrosa]
MFVRAYGALLGYAPAKVRGLRLRAWLVTIAVNLCRNEARGRQRAPAVVGLEEVVEPRCQWDAFDDVVERLDLRAWLARLTALLPKHQRMAVVLRHGCGLSIGEVSAAMGCAESTARSYASRGLARLRELVAEQGVERGFGEAQAA